MTDVAVFEPAATRDLTGDPHDDDFTSVLLACYLRMLPQRVRRVALALDADDHDDARDAVLSLTVSAATVGARQLAVLGREIDRHLGAGDRAAAIATAVRLPEVADRVAVALEEFLGG